MEKKRSTGKRHAARGGERASALIERLRRSPVAYHVLLIVLTLTAIIVVSSLLMMFITRHGTHRTVPDFMGVKIAEAQRAAQKSGLEIIVNDSLFVSAYEGGIVLDQLPKGGVEVKAGRKIYVTINSFRQKMVKVPYVAGRSLRQAKNMLEVAGLGIERLVYETDIATNYVLAEYADDREIGQDSDVQIEMGSGVVLKVGVEPEKNTTIVPKTIGQTLQEAKSRLWEQGLNVGEVTFDNDVDLLDRKNARVYSQSLGHNAGARLGTAVSLRLTLDEALVERVGKASDKMARELAEQRLREEQERLDSLESAERDDVVRALRESGAAHEEVSTTDEDEFF